VREVESRFLDPGRARPRDRSLVGGLMPSGRRYQATMASASVRESPTFSPTWRISSHVVASTSIPVPGDAHLAFYRPPANDTIALHEPVVINVNLRTCFQRRTDLDRRSPAQCGAVLSISK